VGKLFRTGAPHAQGALGRVQAAGNQLKEALKTSGGDKADPDASYAAAELAAAKAELSALQARLKK
jgi:hypothetical protein